MYKGEIVEQGEVRKIYNAPKHPYTIGLLACKPPVNINLKELPTRKHFIGIDKDGFVGDVVKSVNDVLQELKIDSAEIEFRNSILYNQIPLLEAKNLKNIILLKIEKIIMLKL